MAAKKVGVLIKEARTAAGLTQAELAKAVGDISANDISKVERGEKDLPAAQLKLIAKVTGITQKSLVEAPSNLGKSSSPKSSDSGKKEQKASTASGSTMNVTAAEKKLIEAYRKADSEAKKNALKILKGEAIETGNDVLSIITGAIGALGKK